MCVCVCLFVLVCVCVTDVWEDSHAGLHSDQQEQQLPNISSGRSPPLQVRCSSSSSSSIYSSSAFYLSSYSSFFSSSLSFSHSVQLMIKPNVR